MRYLLTFTCYGHRLHGHPSGSVDRHNRAYLAPFLPPDPQRLARACDLMKAPPYLLDEPRRRLVLSAMQDVCRHREWTLWAAHLRNNHVHAIVEAPVPPEQILNTFKAYATRRLLAEVEPESPSLRRWTRHGSTRYLFTDQAFHDAITYVIDRQGGPLTTWLHPAYLTPRPF